MLTQLSALSARFDVVPIKIEEVSAKIDAVSAKNDAVGEAMKTHTNRAIYEHTADTRKSILERINELENKMQTKQPTESRPTNIKL
jgi:hypothetical protein